MLNPELDNQLLQMCESVPEFSHIISYRGVLRLWVPPEELRARIEAFPALSTRRSYSRWALPLRGHTINN